MTFITSFALIDEPIKTKTAFIMEDPGVGTNTITLQSPTLAGNLILTLPTTDGSPLEFLKTNGSGVLSWATSGGSNTFQGVYDNSTPTVDFTVNDTQKGLIILDNSTPISGNLFRITDNTQNEDYIKVNKYATTISNPLQNRSISNLAEMSLGFINRSTGLSTVTSLTSVVWSPELKIFMGSSIFVTNNIQKSTDGITWTGSNLGSGASFSCITWSPELGLFLIIKANSNQAYTSVDTITWIPKTMAQSSGWRQVIWVSELSLFIVVGSGTYPIITTPTGGTNDWTIRTSTATSLEDLVWSPELGLIVAVGTTGQIYTSPDGINWTSQTFGSQIFYGVEWSSGLNLFVAVTGSGTGQQIYSSPDGITWTYRTIPDNANAGFRDIKWSPELNIFLAVASTNTTNSNRIYISNNGIDWKGMGQSQAAWISPIAWSPYLGIFVLSTSTTGFRLYTTTRNTSELLGNTTASVTQATSITTAVTINSPNGFITTVIASIATRAKASFTVNNKSVTIGSIILVNVTSYGGSSTSMPVATVTSVTNGSFIMNIINAGSSSLNASMIISFTVN